MFYPYIEEGGLVWMLPIVFLSFVALALCLERGWYWIVSILDSRGRTAKLRDFFRSPFNIKSAIQACSQSKDIVLVILHEFLVSYESTNLNIAEHNARMFADEKVDESRKSLDILSLIASLSGTLGLMGTVVGISITFKSLALQDPKGMSLSLATALYTTDAGIILFLMSYISLFFFQKFTDNLGNTLDVTIQKLKDLLETEEKSRMIFDTPSTIKNPENYVLFDDPSEVQKISNPNPGPKLQIITSPEDKLQIIANFKDTPEILQNKDDDDDEG